MSRSTRLGECVYCGSKGVITSDHVPPKCIFPPQTRINLVTVDACEQCHDSFKLDDEYFRLALSIRPDLPNQTTASYLFDKTKRSLNDPKAQGLRKKLVKSVRSLAIHSQGGIYLGDTKGVRIDFRRLNETAKRMIKGFYAHYYKEPLPSTYLVDVHFTELQRDSSAIDTVEIKELLSILARVPVHKLGGDIVEIRSTAAEDDRKATVWFVRILQAVSFFGFTYPQER